MEPVEFDLGIIFINTLIFFILGLITQYAIKVNINKIISKITYILIIFGMWWIVLSNPNENVDQTIESINKLTYFFINVIIPFIVGEAIGDTIASYWRSFKRAFR